MSCFEVIFYHGHASLSTGSSPALRSWQPLGMYDRAERAGWHVERKRGRERHMVNEQCRKRYDLQSGKADGPCVHTQTNTGIHTQSVFYVTFYPVDSFPLLYQGCDSKESNNQQLTHGVIQNSTVSIASLFHFATKNSCILFSFFVFVEVFTMFIVVDVFFLAKPTLFTYHLQKVC